MTPLLQSPFVKNIVNYAAALFRDPPPPPPPTPKLSDWYNSLELKPFSHFPEGGVPQLFTFEHFKLPPVLECDNLMIYNGVRAPGGMAIYIEHIVFYGSKEAFRMLGTYFIAAALRIKYDTAILLKCTNTDLSPVGGIKIGMPEQSKFEKTMKLAPCVLTQWSWTPYIPADRPEQWGKEFSPLSDYPVDHLPLVRLGSPEQIYSEHHRPRSKSDIIVHVKGTLPSLFWLGNGLLNFALEDNPCHTVSLLNYSGHNCLASGSAELRFVSPGGADVHPEVQAWLESQRPIVTSAEPEPETTITAEPAHLTAEALSEASATETSAATPVEPEIVPPEAAPEPVVSAPVETISEAPIAETTAPTNSEPIETTMATPSTDSVSETTAPTAENSATETLATEQTPSTQPQAEATPTTVAATS